MRKLRVTLLLLLFLFLSIQLSVSVLYKTKTEEFAFKTAEIDVKRTIELETENGKSLILFQRTLTSDYGIGFLNKNLLYWELRVLGGYVRPPSPEMGEVYWHYALNEIDGKQTAVIYGIAKEHVKKIDIIFTNSVVTSKMITRDSINYWYALVDNPDLNPNKLPTVIGYSQDDEILYQSN